jgi:hypothetical protein
VIIDKKMEFLNAYEKMLQEEADKNKLLSIYPELEKDYPDFFNPNNVLRQFLTRSLDILKTIDDIQEYRRTLVSVSIDESEPTEDLIFGRISPSIRYAIDEIKALEMSQPEDADKVAKIRKLLEEILSSRSINYALRRLREGTNYLCSISWQSEKVRSDCDSKLEDLRAEGFAYSKAKKDHYQASHRYT